MHTFQIIEPKIKMSPFLPSVPILVIFSKESCSLLCLSIYGIYVEYYFNESYSILGSVLQYIGSVPLENTQTIKQDLINWFTECGLESLISDSFHSGGAKIPLICLVHETVGLSISSPVSKEAQNLWRVTGMWQELALTEPRTAVAMAVAMLPEK